jgi:hypothetical protein
VDGINNVLAVGDQTCGLSLLHQLVEEPLKALGPQSQAEAPEGGVIQGQLLGTYAQETLEHQVPGGLLFQLPVREVIEELQKVHLEHDYRVPQSPGPSQRKSFSEPL